MNKNAANYKWYFTGFGDPIIRYTDTATISYSGSPYSNWYSTTSFIALIITGQTGCKDSLIQVLSIRKKSSTYVGVNSLINKFLNVDLYPNPIQNKLNLEFEPSKIRLDKLTISNTFGQIVFSLMEPQARQEVDLTFLESGLYFVKVQNKEGQKVIKVIKE